MKLAEIFKLFLYANCASFPRRFDCFSNLLVDFCSVRQLCIYTWIVWISLFRDLTNKKLNWFFYYFRWENGCVYSVLLGLPVRPALKYTIKVWHTTTHLRGDYSCWQALPTVLLPITVSYALSKTAPLVLFNVVIHLKIQDAYKYVLNHKIRIESLLGLTGLIYCT